MSTANVKLTLPPRRERVVSDEPPAPEAVRDRSWKKSVRKLWIVALAWCVGNPGWFVSVLFHLGLAACFTSALIHETSQDGKLILQVVPGGDLGGTEFDTILGGSPPGDSALEISEAPPSMQKTLLETTAETENSGLVALGTPTAMSLLGGGGNGGSGGGGQGGGGPGGPGIGFFGSQATGNDFVYVVDMSGSMQGGRFDRAISELIRSINQLKANQKFYVVFFNDQPLPLYSPRPATSLQIATQSNRQRAVRWIRDKVRPNSLTNPDRALEIALDLKPDAIFLLTDGEFQDDVPALLRKLNKNGVVIHTIAFEGREGEPMLEAIAKENKGTYRFVK